MQGATLKVFLQTALHCTCQDLCALCPDQKGLLRQVAKKASTPVVDVMSQARKVWGYKHGNALFLSMWGCILVTDDVLKHAVSELKANQGHLAEHLKSMYQRDGKAPHPEVLLRSFFSGLPV